MTITKLEDTENHKNAFEISGIDCKYFYYLLQDMLFQISVVLSEQRGKLLHCEGDQALALVAWRDFHPWQYSKAI